jgi:hypothetical protein
MTNIVIPSARRLKTSDPRIVQKFNQEYMNFIKYHKLHTKLYQLEKDMTTKLTETQQQQYESNLIMRNKGILLAEKQCWKLRMGMVPFSDELNVARMKIQLWKAVITKKRGCKYSNNKLRCLEQATGLKQTLHLTLEENEHILNTKK